jgi:hypothetical protein
MKRIFYTAILALALHTGPVFADETSTTNTPAKACSAPEFRQLDFWVGDWNLSYSQGEGKPRGTAHNVISKTSYGNCVISEAFTMPGFTGMSVSTYHKHVGKWRQTWVDDQGGYYDLAGGPAKEGENYDFGLELVHPEGMQAPYLRMIWQIKDADHLVWRWQGKKKGDPNWTDRWVIDYERVTPSNE